MTQYVFAGVGFFMFGPPGAVAGYYLGSYIDEQYLFPAIYGKDTGEVQAFDKLTITSSAEGSSFPYCLGPRSRVPGVVIWMKEPWSYYVPPDNNNILMGKGGAGSRPEATVQVYWLTDVKIAFNQGRQLTTNPIVRLLGNNRVIYEYNRVETQVGYAGSAYDTYNAKWFYLHWYPNPENFYLGLNFQYGTSMTVSGWVGYPLNNGTKTPVDSGLINGVQRLYVSETLNTATIQSYTTTYTQTITGWHSPYITGSKIYTGSWTQDADEANDNLDEIWGGTGSSGKWPAYRSRAYISLMSLVLTQFSNQLPRFDFIVQADGTPGAYTYRSAITQLCTDAGVDSGDIDVSGIPSDQYMEGAVFYGPRAAKQWIQNLMLAGNILFQRDGGTFKFFGRSNISEYTIDEEDIGVFEYGDAPSSEGEITNLEKYNIPIGAIVEFFDMHNGLEKGSVEWNMDDQYTAFDEANILKYTLSVTMSRAEAEAIAKRQTWLARAAKQYCRIQVPFKYCQILENDAVVFTKYGRDWRFVVQKRDRAYNGLLVLEGPYSPSTMDDWEWTDNEQGEYKGSRLTSPPEDIQGEIIDIAPLHDQHANMPGFYFAAGPYTAQHRFTGVELWQSHNDTDYYKLSEATNPAGFCQCTTTLGGSVDPAYWDLTNTVQIRTLNKALELESMTTDEVLYGFNRLAIKTSSGWEVIGFADVQVDGTTEQGKVYTLSTLLRGLCNTEDIIDSHSSDELALVLTYPGIVFVPLNTQARGLTRYFKIVPRGGSIDDYSSFQHTIELGTVRPFQPCSINGTRDASDNLTITWDRRSRFNTRMFALETPLDDYQEEYEIEIYDDTTLVRLIRHEDLTGDKEHLYTAAQQTADGLTPGDPVKVKIYQVSVKVGRGRGLEATI